MPNLHRGALDAQSLSRAAAAEQHAFEREILALRRELASLKLEYELRRFQQKYSPNQPRVPAGNPDGGQCQDGEVAALYDVRVRFTRNTWRLARVDSPSRIAIVDSPA